MSAYSIWIVTPPRYRSHRAFDDVAIALSAAFRALGYEAPIVRDPGAASGTIIVLGANLLPRVPIPTGKNLILFNLEQVVANSAWMNAQYLALLQRFPVWDYSRQNIKALREYGIEARHCGIGYMPELTCIAPAEEDIDILFIGLVSPRRHAILQEVGGKGAVVRALHLMWGANRDRYIARSKIVLNVHYYDARVLEIVRLSYLLANRKCVVSEAGLDHELEEPLRRGVAFTSYEGLVPICLELLSDSARREAIAQAGFECMSSLSQVEFLRRALAD